MIRSPRLGQRVRLHYAARMRPAWHGCVGTVVCVSGGPGPRNVGVQLMLTTVVIPRGNLVVEVTE
jgi:hypothetical protein